MKITFDAWNQNPTTDKTSAYDSLTGLKTQESKVQNAYGNAFRTDLSGEGEDRIVYGEQESALRDMMQSFDAQIDPGIQLDYMTLMSNILSAEDYNKMMKDGFDPSKMDPEQYVTIVDHIKAEMAKSGTIVSGYNDDMTTEELKEVLGDSSLAGEVERALQESNLPVSEENVTAIKEALDKAEEITSYDEASKKYMVENHMEPTVENMYRSRFSASGDGSRQPKGYYAQEMPGYFAKKAEGMDWESLQPQIEKALARMNLTDQQGEESVQRAKWLMERGISLTEDHMLLLERADSVQVPLDRRMVIRAGVHALLEGKAPAEGRLTESGENIYDKAIRYVEETAQITEDALRESVKNGGVLNLRNLYAQQRRSEGSFSEETGDFPVQEKYVTAARQLAEVQLKMTVDVNVRLLKSGYAIDTAPLSELVEVLKKQEEELAAQFFGREDTESVSEKAELFQQTRTALQEIPFLPAAVIGRITRAEEVSLSGIHSEGVVLRHQYEAAGESYEALMTSPRADMGDSIRKAFRNVDDILQDMDIEQSKDNEKAVRILGYNSMEITKENIFNVKEKYLQVENVIRSMTPQKTLGMIREGVNPLTMDLEELEDYLNGMDSKPEEDMAGYSRFLYELEKNGQITDAERESYIGVYRLFHQIEKNDGAVIGSLTAQGAELTLGNLLTASRSRKKMDYKVDDSFGAIKEINEKGRSISDQIESGIKAAQKQVHSILRDMDADVLSGIAIQDNMTPDQLKDAMQGAEEALPEKDGKDLFSQYREDQNEVSRVRPEIPDLMQKQQIPVTVENVLAMDVVLTQKGRTVRDVRKMAEDLPKDRQMELADREREIMEQFDDYDSAQSAFERWENCMKEIIKDSVYTASEADAVRRMQMNYRQTAVMGGMRRNESYEIPLEMNGEITSINLTLVRDAEEKGSVSITMETGYFGKAGAKFHLNGDRIDSYFVADSEMGKDRLQVIGARVLSSFEKKGMKTGDTRYVNMHVDTHAQQQGKKGWDLLTFSDHNDDNNSETVASRQLYQVAKTFLMEMRDFT